MLKVVIGGAHGRVGQCLTQLVQEDPELSLVAAVGRPTSKEGALNAVTQPFDVFIDFTQPQAVLEHLHYCTKHKNSMVIGVTGLNDDQKSRIQEASKIIPIVFSPNMSVGINVSYKLLELATKVLHHHVKDFGIAIQEMHHKNKKDSPSGTSLKMGEIMASSLGKLLNESNINFASTRVGDIMGEHNVLFALPGEQLEIKHRTETRSIYAQGALIAAKWLAQQPPGLYDMQDVLGL